MTETMKKSIPEINAVDGFTPAEFTRELSNDDGTLSLYMDVKYRLLWFRLHCPNGKIEPEIVRVDDKFAVMGCKLYRDRSDPVDQFIAKGYAQRFASSEKYGDRFLEIAETAALGRALAAAGYGTQFCGASDMLSGIIADAPIDMPAEEEGDQPVGVSSQVIHQVKAVSTAQPAPTVSVAPIPAPQPLAPPAPESKPVAPTTLEDYLNSMSLEDAKNVMVDVGYNSGRTLGELAMRKPSDLEWYVKHYSGRNLALKAGAILLMGAATAKAS